MIINFLNHTIELTEERFAVLISSKMFPKTYTLLKFLYFLSYLTPIFLPYLIAKTSLFDHCVLLELLYVNSGNIIIRNRSGPGHSGRKIFYCITTFIWQEQVMYIWQKMRIKSWPKERYDRCVEEVCNVKAVPLHAMEALGGRGGIAPTHSRPRH
jgi:hypothetical protein